MLLLALVVAWQTPESVRLSYRPVAGSARHYVYADSVLVYLREPPPLVDAAAVYFVQATSSDSQSMASLRVIVDSTTYWTSTETERHSARSQGVTVALRYNARRQLTSPDSADLLSVVPVDLLGLVANSTLPLPDTIVRKGSSWTGPARLRIVELGWGTGFASAQVSCKVQQISVVGSDTVVRFDIKAKISSDRHEVTLARGGTQTQWVSGELKGSEEYSTSQSATASLHLRGTITMYFDVGAGRAPGVPKEVHIVLAPVIVR